MIICHLEYCHSLLTGPFLSYLSPAQIFLNCKSDHVTSLSKTLQWFSTACEMKSKTLSETYTLDLHCPLSAPPHLRPSSHTDPLPVPPVQHLPGDVRACVRLLLDSSSRHYVRPASPHQSLRQNVWGLSLKCITFAKRSFVTILTKVTSLTSTNTPTP